LKIPSAKIVFNHSDKKEILNRINDSLSTGQLTLNKYCKEFEDKFSKYIGAKYAISVNSGTSAIEIILRALNIKNSSVIVPTNTFSATAFAVDHSGNRIIFADCAGDYCIDIDSIKNNIKSDTKAIIVVHIGGNISRKLEEIKEFCEEHQIYLIEDAAHAHGSSLNGLNAGTLGIAAAFSFYPTKVMTCGEGGIITTDNEEIYKKALQFRDQGKESFFSNRIVQMGYNWRMSELHAAIGIQQLHRINEFILDRRLIASFYDKRITEIEALIPFESPKGSKSNYYKYIATLKKGIDRTKLKKKLREEFEISLSGEVYNLPLHLQPIFKKICGAKEGDFPVSEDLCARQICLPIFATMTEEEANYVLSGLKKALLTII